MLFSLIGILLIASFNYVVDPFNVNSLKISGFNDKKPDAQHRLRVALNVIKNKPKTIVLGTSRANNIDEECLRSISEGLFYNAGLPGANFDEIYAYFLHALYVQPDLKKVVLGIDLFSFNLNRKPQADFKEERLQKSYRSLTDHKDTLLTRQALLKSWECVYSSFFDVKMANKIAEIGDEVYLKSLLDSEEFYKDFAIDSEKIKKFQSMVEICQSRGIELQAFVCPVKALYWEFYYQNGLWPHVEDLKRQLCAVHPIWDFSGFNPITMETLDSGGKDLYHECSHFTFYVGGLLIKRMFGEPSSIDSVGYLLSPETVESSLAEILEPIQNLRSDDLCAKRP